MTLARAPRNSGNGTGGKSKGRSAALLRRRPLAESLAQMGRMAGYASIIQWAGYASLPLLICNAAWAQTAPRLPVNALPALPTTEYGAAIGYQSSGSTATITQTVPTNIVNWKSFDIGSAARVNVVQPSSASVLLNKVESGAYLNKTTIDGMLNANGRVYIYNPNGVLFGSTAAVNVNTLIASSLKFDETRVIGGLLQPGSTPVLGVDDPNYLGAPGDVQVEGGATLTSGNGGLIMLAAPGVGNNGVLNAPDGQVILSAGRKIYLAAPPAGQTALRGLLVEVCNEAATCTLPPSETTGTSLAENGVSGQIKVGQGNATMIGYAVNQNGLVSATTSVNLNGSIHLYARDQAQRPDANGSWQATRSGKLVLGAGSVTEVLPTLSDTATISATTAFNKSDVKLNGANIELQENASIIAPGGNVAIKAQRLSNNEGANDIIDPATDIVRVDFAPGSSVDVSGSTGTKLAMESNVISLDLRGTELADNTVLRDSSLYGTTVQVDIRKGTPVANISGWLDLLKYNLGQKNAGGGKVIVNADGAIIQRAGSKINVDGGWVDYLTGYVNTTKLQLGDKLVDIGSAAPNVWYAAAVNLPDEPTSVELGYRQGSSAGTVQLSAPIVVQQGDLSGHATVGSRQRDVTAVDALYSVNNVPLSKVVFGYPQGGELQIGNVNGTLLDAVSGKANISFQIDPNASSNQFVYAGNLLIAGATETATPPEVGAVFDYADPGQSLLAGTLNLDPVGLPLAGFSRISALTSGNINVNEPVELAAGGHLWLGAGKSPAITTPGGDITFSAPVSIAGGSVAAAASGTLLVEDNPHAQSAEKWGFDLAGRWTNDRSQAAPVLDGWGNPVTPLVLKGGALNLSAKELTLGSNVSADVSAGAWSNAQGKVSQGNAGSITLQATPSDAVLHLGSGLNLSAYGFSSGGTLKLVGRNVSIGGAPPFEDNDDLWLQPAFFEQGGFTNYDINANVNFEVQANTLVTPRALSWQFNPGANMFSSGAMAGVATPELFDLSGPARTRPATSMTYRAYACASTSNADCAGMLVVNNGAQLLLDPGATLNLYAGRQLTELGTLSAPAGHINLGLTPKISPPSAKNSIWFGPNAQVLAVGSLQRLYTNGDGVSSGEVLDGGSIQIGSIPRAGVVSGADGYVVAEFGSMFNVGGVGASGLSFKSNGSITPKQNVASAGGSIDISAREGLLFEGTLMGAAGGAGASGGALTVGLEMGDYQSDGDVLTILSSPTLTSNIVPRGLQPNDSIFAAASNDIDWLLSGSGIRHAGQGWISTASFAPGGFGRIKFKSQDALAFGLGQSDLTLSAKDALILDAPNLRAFNNLQNNSVLSTDGAAISHTLTLSAPYIRMGNTDESYELPGASSTGIAQMEANASTLDLIGNSALQGFDVVNLNARDDIRLNSFPAVDAEGNSTGYTRGSLAMTGNLTLTDAQTYPTTLSDFTFMLAAKTLADSTAADPDSGLLTFITNGNAPLPVLSAGGSLTAIAPHILQAGVVAAPFGSITLGNLDSTPLSATWNDDGTLASSPNNPVFFGSIALDTLRFPGDPRYAAQTPDVFNKPIITADLEYAPGSVTTVAGSGIVPFGSVSNGSVPTASAWQYSTLASFVLNPGDGSGLPERVLPRKEIISHAQSIQADSGSVQDLSGGGSLLAYEWTKGKGGSKDVLASSTTYAINPNFQGSVAPIDSDFGSNGLKAGDSVYLSAAPGLAAGIYTLLPAHYALLPGGLSVSVAPNTRDMQPGSNLVLPDGSMLVAGHLSESGSGSGSMRSNGFIVSLGAVVSKKSEFTLFDAATYFTAKATAAGVAAPELPLDGGRIAFDVSGSGTTDLAMHSSIILAAADAGVIKSSLNNTKWTGAIELGNATGGRAGNADISAPLIEVVSAPDQGMTNAVKLVAGDLVALGAESILIGGLRNSATADGSMLLSVGANGVTLSNDAQNPLSGAEILIAAKRNIDLNPGATVAGSGTLSRPAQDLTVAGSGALLRVSGGSQVALTRGDLTETTGTLNIASGAIVAASGSALLDATAGFALGGALDMAPGSALSLGAPGISMGSDIPATLAATNLQLGTEVLSSFGTLSDLAFNSYDASIALYGTVNLGDSAMHSLSFQGAGIQGYGSADEATAGQASLIASSMKFAGTAEDASPLPSATSSGLLAVQASTLTVDGKAFAIQGYADTTLNARGELKAVGTSGLLSADNNLTLAAGIIDSASGANASFKAGGDMTLTRIANERAPVTAPGLGGS